MAYREPVGTSGPPRTATRGRLLAIGLPIAMFFASTLSACNDEPTAEGIVEPTDAYTAIVAWQTTEQDPIVDDDGEAQLPVIFVVAASGDLINVGVQAAVAEATADEAVVRFADEATDGFDPTADGSPVREGGVMLAIGAIPEPAHSIDVDVDRYTVQHEPEQLTLTITAQYESTDEPVARAIVTQVTPR